MPWTLWSSSQPTHPGNQAIQKANETYLRTNTIIQNDGDNGVKWDNLPLTCWSRRPRPHLRPRQCSGQPLTQLPRSGVLSHPVGNGHTHTHTSVIKCHVFFPSTYFQSSVCVLTVFAYELCAFISICVYMYVSYPQGPDVHEASHSSRCQGQTIRTESQCSYWSDVAL